MAGGLIFLWGLIWAFIRRLSIPQVYAMSSAEDFWILIFLILIVGLGLWQSAVQLVFGVAYSAGPWIGSILKLQPDASLIEGAPLVNKLHMILAMIFFAWFPFTKLVHFASYPFGYITRGFISMRRYKVVKK
jgi:respiratory nitrate reductase gamma subunit